MAPSRNIVEIGECSAHANAIALYSKLVIHFRVICVITGNTVMEICTEEADVMLVDEIDKILPRPFKTRHFIRHSDIDLSWRSCFINTQYLKDCCLELVLTILRLLWVKFFV